MKEKMRAVRSSLPYKKLPRIMLGCLYRFVVLWRNAFPAKNSILRVFSPRQIVSGRRLDVEKHAPAMFGEKCKMFAAPELSNVFDLHGRD